MQLIFPRDRQWECDLAFKIKMMFALRCKRKLSEGGNCTELYTQQPYLSHMLDAEEKEMKSFEMQLSHSLLFPLKPNYFSTRIQHVWWHMETGWAHEPRGIVQHSQCSTLEAHGHAQPPPLWRANVEDDLVMEKPTSQQKKESQKITPTPACHLVTMPADKIVRSKTSLVGQHPFSFKS